MKTEIYVIALICSLLFSCKKDTETTQLKPTPVDSQLLKHYFFKPGSWWIFKNQFNQIDSVTVTHINHGVTTFLGKGVSTISNDFFAIWMTSSFSNNEFNYYFMYDYIKQNGGGFYSDEGQPVLITDERYTYFNGAEVEAKFDSLVIEGKTYHKVTKMKIMAAKQYKHVFTFDTYLYFAENTGLIQKEIEDTVAGWQKWSLINSKLIR